MKPIWLEKIRKLLRKEEDGLTANSISEKLGASSKQISGALNRMPDIYIDRWTEGGRRQPPKAIWCIANVPENCPRPKKAKVIETICSIKENA